MHMLEQRIQQHFFDSADLKYQTAETLARPIADAAGALLGTITAGGKMMAYSSGIAAPMAQHAAALFVGRFERERPPLAALALSGQAPLQLQALGHPGDLLLLFDAGEADPGAALAAIAAAQAQEMTVVVLAGRGGGALREALAETDVMIAVPHERSPRVLEMHLLVLHCLCDAVDLQLMGEQDP